PRSSSTRPRSSPSCSSTTSHCAVSPAAHSNAVLALPGASSTQASSVEPASSAPTRKLPSAPVRGAERSLLAADAYHGAGDRFTPFVTHVARERGLGRQLGRERGAPALRDGDLAAVQREARAADE